LLSGFVRSGSFSDKGIVLRTDSLGNEFWRKFPMPTLNNNTCNTIRKFNSGYLTTGGEDSSYIVKLDTSGTMVKYKAIPLPDSTYSYTINEIWIELDKFNNIIHYRNQSTKFGLEYFTNIKKLDSNFNILIDKNLKIYHSFIRISSCLTLNNGDIIFSGACELSNMFFNRFYAIRTDKYFNFPPLQVTNTSFLIPEETELISNYPNPFNATTKIKFNVAKSGVLKLNIYNSRGQIVSTLINNQTKQGIFELIWDSKNLPSGIYYAVLINNVNLINSLKLILVK
jgi:hypothetical protein